MDEIKRLKRKNKMQVVGLSLIIIGLMVCNLYTFYLKDQYTQLSEVYCQYSNGLSDVIVEFKGDLGEENLWIYNDMKDLLYPECPSDYDLTKMRYNYEE